MLVIGVVLVLSSAGVGTLLAWQNRAAVVQVRAGHFVWTVRLYGVLVLGALLVCWFLLGAAFVQCRLAERRRARRQSRAPAAPAADPARRALASPRMSR